MRHILKLLALTTLLSLSAPNIAASPTDTFARCLVDTLNGKERKALAKWIFFSIAAHPEISTYSNATEADTLASDKYVGALITRLLTLECPIEFKTANSDDPLALQKAFELVGQVAMQELMTNDDVMATVSNYARYTDLQKIEEVITTD